MGIVLLYNFASSMSVFLCNHCILPVHFLYTVCILCQVEYNRQQRQALLTLARAEMSRQDTRKRLQEVSQAEGWEGEGRLLTGAPLRGAAGGC